MFTYFIPVFFTLLQLIVPILIGFALKRFGSWPKGFFNNLSRFLVRIVLPIYQFTIVSRTDYAELKSSWPFFIACFLVMAVSIGISYGVFRILPVETGNRRLMTGYSSFGNAGYIPLSIVEIMPVTMPALSTYFGVNAPAFYISIFVFCQSPMLWTIGNYLITGKGRRPKLQELIAPPMIGIMAGLVFLIPQLRDLVATPNLPMFHVFGALERFGKAAIPLILVGLGTMIADIKLDRTLWKPMIKMVLPVMGMRFIVMPGLFFGTYLLFRRGGLFAPVHWFVLFLEMSNPPATNLSVMASQAGVNENKTAFVIMATYLSYLIVLPVYLLLFLGMPGVLAGSGPAG